MTDTVINTSVKNILWLYIAHLDKVFVTNISMSASKYDCNVGIQYSE